MRAFILLLAVVCHGWAGEESLGEFGTFRTLEFDRLSNRNLSRHGALALKMPGVVWVHGESTHFIYHFEQGFLCPQFAMTAELFYRNIKADLGIGEDSQEGKARIYVFLGTNSWNEFACSAKLEKWTGAFQNGNELFVSGRANQNFELTASFPHEITHLIVNRFIGDVPLWLNEGIAEYEGRRQRAFFLRRHGKANARFVVPNRSVSRQQFIPLAELTTMADYPADESRVRIFYAEAELLVRYLVLQSGSREKFLEFVKLQAQGLAFVTALQKVYGDKFRDLVAFEKAFADYAALETKPD
ncbi:MAG: hypothetical protein PCFJNLEI_02613 [Verrucomicrobiae bacterium]|nr:hypothetical protein [Verrucomicrobiae bacterium]